MTQALTIIKHPTTRAAGKWLLAFGTAFLLFLLPQFGFCDDPFSDGKQTVTDSVGQGSTIQYVIGAAALIIGLVTGLSTKNWFLGVAIVVVPIILMTFGNVVLMNGGGA